MPDGPPFELFGASHLWTLGLIAAIGILLPLAVRRLRPSAAGAVAVALALLMLGQEVADLTVQLRHRGPSVHLLPLHLCSLALFITAWALVSRRPRVFEVAYFWAFAGTTQALLTPDLAAGFPAPGYLFFFAGHGLVVIGVLYGVIALGLRPVPRSIWRVTLITLALAAVIFGINAWLGTNFLYLMAKPPGPSLLDWFGPWPWYWIGLLLVGLVSFGLLYLPFLLLDLARRPRHGRR
jgi:hypothetical integral membrane protein (TIGR02206 family)